MKYIPVVFFLFLVTGLSAQKDSANQALLPPDSTFYESLPEYPGGQKEMANFIVKNLNYPQMAKEQGIQGTVYVRFTVDVDGSLKNIQIIRGLSGDCDKEVLRVIGIMPKWIPGTANGRSVKTMFTLPVKFVLK